MSSNAMPQEQVTISYSRIIGYSGSGKAVQLDLGERAVWFPLGAVAINENDFTATVPKSLWEDKQNPKTGHDKNGAQPMVRLLADPVKHSGKSCGYEVLLTRMGSNGYQGKEILWLPKSQIKDGHAPLWLVKKEEDNLIEKVCQTGRYSPKQFKITGWRSKDSVTPAAKHESTGEIVTEDGEVLTKEEKQNSVPALSYDKDIKGMKAVGHCFVTKRGTIRFKGNKDYDRGKLGGYFRNGVEIDIQDLMRLLAQPRDGDNPAPECQPDTAFQKVFNERRK